MTGLRMPRSPLAVAGFGLIWAFLIVFILYPLTRIFYDAFTSDAGVATLTNFREFFSDDFYLRSLWRSLRLGVAAVGVILIVLCAVSLYIVNRIAGTRVGGLFG